jgi:hypothetical protein
VRLPKLEGTKIIFSPSGIPAIGIVLLFPLRAPLVDKTTTGNPLNIVVRDFLP